MIVRVIETGVIAACWTLSESPTLLDSGLTITMRSSLTVVEGHTEVEAYEDRGGVSLNCRSRSRIQMCLTSKAFDHFAEQLSFLN